MTLEEIHQRALIGPVTTGDLRRAGATDEQISGLLLVKVLVVLQHNDDPDAEILGAYEH